MGAVDSDQNTDFRTKKKWSKKILIWEIKW